MSVDFLKRLGLFVVFVLAQALVLGHIHLLHYATPLFYVYFIAMLPRNYPKWGAMLWAFCMGLAIDTFANTPGMAAASLTLLATVQPYYLQLFVSREAPEDLVPTLSTMGPVKYAYYIIVLVLFYATVFYTIELFSFLNPLRWLLCIVGSTLVTLPLIYTFEIARRSK